MFTRLRFLIIKHLKRVVSCCCEFVREHIGSDWILAVLLLSQQTVIFNRDEMGYLLQTLQYGSH